jgi:DNA sulfur modification protein DndB
MKHPNDWVSRLSLLENIDWSRSNSKVWEGVATIGGVVSKARTNLVLTSNFIKSTLNLPLDNKDQPLVVISNSKKRKEKIS